MNAQLANWSSSLLPFGSELLWTALPWMLLYGVLGFVLAIVICYQLAKKCLLVRRPRAWHVAAKLSYVLILVALPVLGGAFGAVHSVHRLVNQALVRDLQPVFEAHAPVLRLYLEQRVRLIAPDQPVSMRSLIEPLVQSMYYKPVSDGVWERSKARWINEFTLRRGSVLLTEVLQAQLVSRVGVLGETLKGSDLRDLSKLDKSLPLVFVDAIGRQASAYFNSLKLTIGLFLLLALLLVWGEIMLYRHYYLRRYPPATAMPVSMPPM